MAVNGGLIAGVGASAGGIEAFEHLFHKRCRPIWAWVSWSSPIWRPGCESALPEIIGRFTTMPVVRADDGLVVEPDHIYVIAPGSALTLRKGRLVARHIEPGAPGAGVHFESSSGRLAEDQGERAVAIILSGSGSDGTLGVKAVKEHGGLTIAQGTNFDGAPLWRHAGRRHHRHGCRGHRGPVQDIPTKLSGLLKSFDSLHQILADRAEESPQVRGDEHPARGLRDSAPPDRP